MAGMRCIVVSGPWAYRRCSSKHHCPSLPSPGHIALNTSSISTVFRCLSRSSISCTPVNVVSFRRRFSRGVEITWSAADCRVSCPAESSAGETWFVLGWSSSKSGSKVPSFENEHGRWRASERRQWCQTKCKKKNLYNKNKKSSSTRRTSTLYRSS